MGFPTWTWPDWKTAPEGTRFKHNRSGATGRLIRPASSKSNGAIVVWDNPPFPIPASRWAIQDVPNSVYFVAIAREATPIPPSA